MLLCNQPHTLCARNRASNRLGDMCLGPAHCCLHSGGFSPLSPCTHTLPKGHIRLVGRTLYDLNLETLHSEIIEVGTGCLILCSLPVSAHNNPPLCTRKKSFFSGFVTLIHTCQGTPTLQSSTASQVRETLYLRSCRSSQLLDIKMPPHSIHLLECQILKLCRLCLVAAHLTALERLLDVLLIDGILIIVLLTLLCHTSKTKTSFKISRLSMPSLLVPHPSPCTPIPPCLVA